MIRSQQKATLSERILKVSFTLCIIFSFLKLFKLLPQNQFSSTNLLEITFYLLVIVNLNGTSLSRFLFALVSFSTIISFILVAELSGTPLYESIRAYKWAFFFIGLILIINKVAINTKIIEFCFRFLLFAMSGAYIIQITSYGIGSRPYLLTENNYECALLIGLYLVYIQNNHLKTRLRKHTELFILVSTILMSQSRSSLLELIAILFIRLKFSRSIKTRLIPLIGLILTSLSAILFTLKNRGSNLANLDRFHFLNLFIHEFKNRSIHEQLFGNWIIKPLNYETCIQLKFYSSLQNDDSLGSCYSVVLHAFLLRAVNDFGILGALCIFGIFTSILLKNLNKLIAISILAVSLINSLSVSGINNIYVILPILFALFYENSRISIKSIDPD